MQMARSDRLLELIIRLRHDLPNRALAALGVAGALFCYINVGLALVWLALVAFNEVLELWITREITRGGAVANRFEAAFFINLAFGSMAWGSAAWVFWTSGGVAGIVIGLAVALGALYHVSCHFISHAPSLAAAGIPLAATYLALPVQMDLDPRYSSATAIEATIGFLFLAAYMASALAESARKERTLREALDEAKAATLAKSRFLAVMSHEIRTPMNGVIGMMDLVVNGELTEEQRECAEAARSSANDLIMILDDLLNLSKIEAGRLELEELPVSPREIVAGATQLYAAKANEKNLHLATTIEPGVPEWIAADPTRLRQILSNLISNAIKFTKSGSVEIILGHQGGPSNGDLTIMVADTGIGVSEGQRARLFEPFSQADVSTTRLYGGTGLGLAICRQLVESMGGRIGVTSQTGVGSRFWFTIPVRTVSAPAHTTLPSSGSQSQQGLRVLVAEDHAVNQKLLRLLLEAAGHEVRVAGDGEAAVACAREEAFDVVLMDVQMPGMDGLTATQTIRAVDGPNRDVPIIAVTANAATRERVRYLAGGMTDCITKPIDATELLGAITRATFGGKQAIR